MRRCGWGPRRPCGRRRRSEGQTGATKAEIRWQAKWRNANEHSLFADTAVHRTKWKEAVTAAILLMITCLLALQIAVGAGKSQSRRLAAIAVAGFSTLPLTFGPIVPISHFVFEASGQVQLLAAQCMVATLLVALVWRLSSQWKANTNRHIRVPLAGVGVSQAIWLGSAAWLSDYERGATPKLWDAQIYIVDWLAAIVACLLLAIAAWRDAGSGKFGQALIIGYILLVMLAIYTTVMEQA